jgi:hypothetical protein
MTDESLPGSGEPADGPSSLAPSFVTTEHFTLQEARASTISESTGRATMFLGSVSGGLVALGLIATATRVGTAFYAFGLALLPTLTFVGLVTFERALQSGIEDHDYALRISRLRAFYFDAAPETCSTCRGGPFKTGSTLKNCPVARGPARSPGWSRSSPESWRGPRSHS